MKPLLEDPTALGVDRSPIHGRGLFARRVIPAGTFLGEYGGRRGTWRPGTFVGRWTFRVGNATRDGRRGGNLLRFANHCAEDPNVRLDGFAFYAAREIAAGEEITFDYGPEWA